MRNLFVIWCLEFGAFPQYGKSLDPLFQHQLRSLVVQTYLPDQIRKLEEPSREIPSLRIHESPFPPFSKGGGGRIGDGGLE